MPASALASSESAERPPTHHAAARYAHESISLKQPSALLNAEMICQADQGIKLGSGIVLKRLPHNQLCSINCGPKLGSSHWNCLYLHVPEGRLADEQYKHCHTLSISVMTVH